MHKLAEVDWTHDPDDAMAPWTFRSRDGRLSLVLTPIAIETGGIDLGRLFQHIQKGYGTLSGTIVLDDGTTLEIEGLRGFAEEVDLSW